jgi:DNA-binding MarR family transcriptional regulator
MKELIARAQTTVAPTVNSYEVGAHYVDTLNTVVRLRYQFLEIIEDEFDRHGLSDLNGVQALLLFKIGDREMTPTEIQSRSLYLGSSVSHHLRKLSAHGYVFQRPSAADRRIVLISLTERGRRIARTIDRLLDRQVFLIDKIGGIAADDLSHAKRCLRRLERLLSDPIIHPDQRPDGGTAPGRSTAEAG